jgi:glycolate oxidase FAD binding subunit
VIYVAVDEKAAPAAVAQFALDVRAAVGNPPTAETASASGPPSRGNAVVLHAPAEVRAAVDVWGPVPALGLMRAVKNQFDPEHRMAPGRFAGGI